MYCYIQVQCNKKSVVGLMKIFEAPQTFNIFSSLLGIG